MEPNRWQQIEELYHAALERAPEERTAFLAETCADDSGLRREVEELLRYDGAAESFIEENALAVEARQLEAEDLSTTKAQALTGQQIGAYRILAPLGKGGMGEVHLALDPRLGRKVAVKLLPAAFTHDRERVRRFEQEARAASALNHPNIITIHEIGEVENTHYIVTEYVEGETLRQRMSGASQRRIEPPEAIDIALQIAAALAAAHEAGIAHRDIKPENVMVRRDGIVKVLDFGLAKLTGMRNAEWGMRNEEAETVAQTPRDIPHSAFRIPHSTAPGVVMGTPRYMSPEQARGEKADARTDIFSLGVMLYEMIAGRPPFAGATVSETIAAILRDEPPSPRALNPGLPVELEHLISKALEKDRDLRCQSAKEMLADLKRLQRDLASKRAAAIQPVAASAPVITARTQAQWRKWAVIAAVPVVVLAGLLLWQWRQPPEPPKVTNYIPITTDGTVLDAPTQYMRMTMVTDGPRLYYSALASGQIILNQVSGAGGEAVTLPTPFRNALLLDISPSQSELLVANFTAAESEAPLWILPIPGGSPRRLGEVQAHAATWAPNGQQIVYAIGSELYLSDSNGTGSRKLLSVEGRPNWLRWSPDGARLRFSVLVNLPNASSLWEANADGTNLRPLLPGWNTPATECCGNWTADGKYFVFQATRNQMVSLWALRENAGGEPVQLTFGPLNFRAPVPSVDGHRLFAVGERRRGELVRYDKRTEQWVSYLSGMSAHMLNFSKDGEWTTYVSYPDGNLWRSLADGRERLQLSFPPMQVHGPRWSPDGKQIAFIATLPGKPWKIYLVSADGGAPRQLMPEERHERDPVFSPDGSMLVFSIGLDTSRTIHLLDLRTGQVSPLPDSKGLFSPRWSPDGRYIAALLFPSNKPMLFDLTTKQWAQLTDLNASYPQWSRDGKYIYFVNQLRSDPPLLRIRISDRKIERWASLKDLRIAPSAFGRWMGLAPDDSPIVLRDVGPQDIYALEWKAP